MRKHC